MGRVEVLSHGNPVGQQTMRILQRNFCKHFNAAQATFTIEPVVNINLTGGK